MMPNPGATAPSVGSCPEVRAGAGEEGPPSPWAELHRRPRPGRLCPGRVSPSPTDLCRRREIPSPCVAVPGARQAIVMPPSPMRQHLIDLAAKRDWKGWRKFLPIFGDWLEENGDPGGEAMACRATWRLA